MNPYAPGQPASPDSFAGRGNVIERVEEAVLDALQIRRSTAVMLHGYRGSGKTSALRKIQAVVRTQAPGSIAAEIPLRVHSSEDRLLATIVQEVGRQLSARPRLGEKVKGFLSRINGLSIAGTGVSVMPGGTDRRTSGLAVWRDCIESLEGEKILLICVDDAELLDASGLGTLKTIAEAHSRVPIILVVAGGVELSNRLGQRETSPILRVFSGARFDIGELSPEETGAALSAPINAVGGTGSWRPDAVREVHLLSHGYPFLVQCLASAAYRAPDPIDVPRVRGTVEAALKIGSSWLERECADASDEDIRAFAKIAAQGRARLRSSEIISLGIQSPYIGRLVRLKILKKISRGHYELQKAPVIAYYHALARDLRLV
ncbi:MAG: ATP-binding protein [Candidatus Lutacidiplasmatales archaeon]